LSSVTDTLAAISTSGAALVVDGEAGIGKSTLLSAIADWAVANGYSRLGCSGLQSQSEVGFAGIHELIHPVLDHTPALPPRQRTALLTAFGLAEGPTPDRLMVSLAVLGLLEESASRRRIVLIIDDVQWLDQSSLEVLAFVARRLSNAPLMMLCAERTGLDGATAYLDGLPRLSLGPLAPEHARQLLSTTAQDADALLQQRVLEQAGGNPLAVIELSGALGERGSSATFSGEPLPTTRRVERAFLSQLDDLTDNGRLLLLLISASGGQLRDIDVHRALADATVDLVRAEWHRAEATFGTDEQVATALEGAARHAHARGAGAESAAALRRAAVLSPEPSSRVRRLTEAAEIARSSGLTAESISILGEAENLGAKHCSAEQLAITRFVLNATAALSGQSATELVALAGKFTDGDAAQRRLLWAAAIECRMHGLAEEPRRDIVAAISRLDRGADDPAVCMAMALLDDTGAGQALRTRLPRFVNEVADDPLLLMALGFAAEAVADRTHAMQCWKLVQSRSRTSGSAADECESQRGASHLLLQEGRIQAAAIAAENALRLARDIKLPMTAASAAATLARVQVWQGRFDQAHETIATARRLLAPDPAILWHDDAHWAAGLLSLFTADPAEALGHLLKMTGHRTSQRWAVADLAEAAAGSDRAELVRPLLAEIEDQARQLGTGLELMLAHRAHALLAQTDDAAQDHFLAALAAGDDADAELETARTHLAYGQWLRRQRRITEARTHLSSALAVFDAAGAAPFVDRAAAELRAAGVATPAGTPRQGPASDLTSQELQIAQLAAAGLTNREIADRIYVSHRTVAAHLYKMFPKLGITNRNQLHTVLGQQQ